MVNGKITTKGLVIERNRTVTGEVNGSKFCLVFSHLGPDTNINLKCGVVESRKTNGTNGVGYVLPFPGSITSISLEYYVSVAGTVDDFNMHLYINNTNIITTSLGITVGRLPEYYTQARDIDTFNAGDFISVETVSSDTTHGDLKCFVSGVFDNHD